MKPTTDKELAAQLLERKAHELKACVGSEIKVTDVLQSVEVEYAYVCIKGVIICDAVDWCEPNIIDGIEEFSPYDYCNKWHFDGEVTIEDEDEKVLKTIEL